MLRAAAANKTWECLQVLACRVDTQGAPTAFFARLRLACINILVLKRSAAGGQPLTALYAPRSWAPAEGSCPWGPRGPFGAGNSRSRLPLGLRDKGQGPRTRAKGQGTRDQGQGTRDQAQGTRAKGPGPRDQGQGPRAKGQGPGTRDRGQGPGPRAQAI